MEKSVIPTKNEDTASISIKHPFNTRGHRWMLGIECIERIGPEYGFLCHHDSLMSKVKKGKKGGY